jgi:hypothetical protein
MVRFPGASGFLGRGRIDDLPDCDGSDAPALYTVGDEPVDARLRRDDGRWRNEYSAVGWTDCPGGCRSQSRCCRTFRSDDPSDCRRRSMGDLCGLALRAKERQRVGILNPQALGEIHAVTMDETESYATSGIRRPKLFWINVVLTVKLMTALLLGWLPLSVLFMIACALAWRSTTRH